MIDEMVKTLKIQQADEVKKNDWCISELQSNDMATARAKDREADLDAASEERKWSRWRGKCIQLFRTCRVAGY